MESEDYKNVKQNRGPRGPRGVVTEKAKDSKGTLKRLLAYIGQHKFAVFVAIVFAIGSVIFNIVGTQ